MFWEHPFLYLEDTLNWRLGINERVDDDKRIGGGKESARKDFA